MPEGSYRMQSPGFPKIVYCDTAQTKAESIIKSVMFSLILADCKAVWLV